MTIKDYIYNLEKNVRKESDEIWSKEKEMSEVEFLSRLAKNNGKYEVINDLIEFIMLGGKK